MDQENNSSKKKCCSCEKEGKFAKGRFFTVTLLLAGAWAVYKYFIAS